MKKTNNTRAFSVKKYPLFGRGVYSESSPPKEVIQSPFYWWYKFLLLNKEYELAIKGKSKVINKSFVKELGNPHKQDFKSWWKDRVDIFAEPKLKFDMAVANDITEIAPFNNPDVINLVVPLNWTNVGIKRSFSRVIDKLVPRVSKEKRGVQTKESEARYKIGRKWSISAFENAYNVYVQKQKADDEMKRGAKKVSWADIGIRAGLRRAKAMKEGERGSMTSDHRRNLTILTLRHYERAEAFIKASITHTFP